jgi:hypothetical protein
MKHHHRNQIGVLITPHLTSGYDEILAHQIRTTQPGMAHFANSGPFGTTCGQCQHLAYYQQRRDAAGNLIGAKFRRDGCRKFFELTGKHGPLVPANAAACKYFERKEKET